MMYWQRLSYILPPLMSAVISLGLAYFAWRRRSVPGAIPFALMLLGAGEWSLGHVFELISPTLAGKIFWDNVQFLGMDIVVLGGLVFTLHYIGRKAWLTRRVWALLTIEPLANLLLIWTDDLHRLVRPAAWLTDSIPNPALVYDWGIWAWVSITYSLLLVLLALILLIVYFIRSPRLYRLQSGAVLLGSSIPWLGGIATMLGVFPPANRDVFPLTFGISNLILAWGLFRYRLLDIMPVARDAVIESMSNGLIVLDAQARVVDINPAAQWLINRTGAEVIGQPAEQVLSGWPDLVERYRDDVPEAHTQIILGEGEAQRYYDLHISPLRDRQGKLTGRVIVLHDTTALKQTEIALREYQRQLEAQNAKLRKLSQAVEQSANTVVITDLEGNIEYANPKFEETTGYTVAEALGQNPRILKSGEQPESYYRELWETITSGQEWRGEFHNKRKDGTLYWEQATIAPVYDAAGRMTHFIAVKEDITARKEAEEELERLYVAEQRQRQMAESLREVATIINSSLKQQTVLAKILEQLRRVIPYDGAAVFLPDGADLVIVAARGAAEIDMGCRVALASGNITIVPLAQKRAMFVTDVQTDPRWQADWPKDEEGNVHGWMGAPLLMGDKVIGVLTVDSFEVGTYSEEDARVLQIFANQAAIAIENARLYEQTQRDATTKATLLREVNHRVKNNLAAIIGIFYAEKRHAQKREQPAYLAFTEDMINRIQGLATVHSLLSASAWEPLLLSELITQVVHPSLRSLPPDKRVSVDVSPSPVRVNAQQANALALVLNELVTNTIKYALQGRATTRITVQIAHADDTVRLEFRDDGPGYPEEVLRGERHNVGLYLIQTIVRKDLRGAVELRNDSGAVTEIKLEIRGQRGETGGQREESR